MLKNFIERGMFTPEHVIFREQVKKFIEKEVIPYHNKWDEDGIVSRDVWLKAGKAGLLCPTISEQYGGPGGDFLFSAIVIEEMARVGASGPGFNIHSEMAAPYLSKFGNDDLKKNWLPKLVSGKAILGVAMTEPSTGSDLRNISTTAKRTKDGYQITGQKVFISNGQLGDAFVVATRTKTKSESNHLSLFLVEANREGFHRGKNLKKMGAKAQDTSELFFDNVFVPKTNLIGDREGEGLNQLIDGLARERLAISIGCVAKAEGAFLETVSYASERKLFNKKLVDFQNTQFRLAEVKTELIVGRCLVDKLLESYLKNQLDADTAAAAKLWSSEMLGRAVDTCLQLFGGWGYMWEYPISKAYTEARVERIAGGTSEVMKSIVCKSIFRDFNITAEF